MPVHLYRRDASLPTKHIEEMDNNIYGCKRHIYAQQEQDYKL